MKINKISQWSLAGFMFGFFFSIFSAIRYFVIYPDMDRALVYVLIGVIIIAISYLYDKTQKLNYEVLAIGDYLAGEEARE